jgi:hypothetical protein
MLVRARAAGGAGPHRVRRCQRAPRHRAARRRLPAPGATRHPAQIHIILFNHHQPINVPTAGAQAWLMGTHRVGPVGIGECNCKYSRDQRLNVPSEARRHFWSPIRPTFANIT